MAVEADPQLPALGRGNPVAGPAMSWAVVFGLLAALLLLLLLLLLTRRRTRWVPPARLALPGARQRGRRGSRLPAATRLQRGGRRDSGRPAPEPHAPLPQ